MSTAPPSSSLRSLFSELEQLFQTETEARVSISVQAAERALAEHLNQAVRRLRQAADFAEMAAILCDAAGLFAHAGAVFHVRESTIGGEMLRGATGDAAAHFRQISFGAAEAAAFAGAIDSREPVVALCSAAEVSPAVMEAFGHAPADKAYLFPLTVDRTMVGVLYATGADDSAALELLAQADVRRTRSAAAPGTPRDACAGGGRGGRSGAYRIRPGRSRGSRTALGRTQRAGPATASASPTLRAREGG